MSLLNSMMPTFSRAPATTPEPGANVPTVKPAYEVKETDEAYGLTVYLPGVGKDNLEITAEEGQFRIFARRNWRQPEGWTLVYRESSDAPFELVLAHDNLVDADKVVAELRDGVLRVSLPKHEAVKPRKIAVS